MLAAAILLTACAAPPKPVNATDLPAWSGRLSITTDATPNQPAQQTSAGFSLQGREQAGQLDLFTPLGGKAAELKWQGESAVLTTSEGKKNYPNLPIAAQSLTGTEIPIAELFDWLQGKPAKASEDENGWKVDLTRYSEGRITASRDWPVPKVVLRVVLER